MNMVAIMTFFKAILPTKKISAWILGLIAAALAMFMGVNNADLKTQFCANEVVSLPAPVVAQPAVVPETAK